MTFPNVSAQRRGRSFVFAAAAGVIVTTAVTAVWGAPETPLAGGNVMHGWRVFHSKKCVDCHSIWDQGSDIGPDLGRIRVGRLSSGQLAGIMWNHIPKMLGRMEETGYPPVTLTSEEMGDLFALIFFVRQLDPLGDPSRGEATLRNKRCSECHTIGSSTAGVGPDLAKWGQYVNPIVWAQLMWEHAPMMEEAMRRSDIEWPKLDGDDLVHIVAYVRSVGTAGEKTYLRPGSIRRGAELFEAKKCDQCHPGPGPDLATAELPNAVGALASRMWNHSPSMMRVMREREVDMSPLSPQELADIVAYILALGHVDRGGEPGHGRAVFESKGCTQCHESEEMTKEGAPAVSQLGADATPVRMASAMWNHGQTMLERMTEAGLAWPEFRDNEMVDLIAYLNSLQPRSEQGGDED